MSKVGISNLFVWRVTGAIYKVVKVAGLSKKQLLLQYLFMQNKL